MRDGTLPGRYTLARMTGACGSGLAPPDGPLPSRHVVAFHSAYRHRDVQMVTLLPAGVAARCSTYPWPASTSGRARTHGT